LAWLHPACLKKARPRAYWDEHAATNHYVVKLPSANEFADLMGRDADTTSELFWGLYPFNLYRRINLGRMCAAVHLFTSRN
jgi:hypothetical protein